MSVQFKIEVVCNHCLEPLSTHFNQDKHHLSVSTCLKCENTEVRKRMDEILELFGKTIGENIERKTVPV